MEFEGVKFVQMSLDPVEGIGNLQVIVDMRKLGADFYEVENGEEELQLEYKFKVKGVAAVQGLIDKELINFEDGDGSLIINKAEASYDQLQGLLPHSEIEEAWWNTEYWQICQG
jgi:hypothetical protein